jgi:phospholipase C
MAAPIEHVIVLMLENRSFDHFLGFLYPASDAFEGLKGRASSFFNLENPLDSTSSRTQVSDDARSSDLDRDSGHDFHEVHEQLFGVPLGGSGAPTPAQNGGFIRSYNDPERNPGAGPRIMRCFNPTTLPILSRLAQEFAVCDHWFSSHPGPTWPNRLFVHTGSSDGRVDNKYRLYDDKTIFNLLTEAGKTWSFFMDGTVTQAMALKKLWSFKQFAFRRLGKFQDLAAAGELPNYSFIEPRFFRGLLQGKPATDQHPPHDVHFGEQLIADVYKMVRTSPNWEKSLLIITYDEHGGLYDHVHPPAAEPPGPVSDDPPFRFDRYGVRVPAVLVSPFIPRGTVVQTVFDHTSIIATVRTIFGITETLSARDASATPVHDCLSLGSPRTDAPLDIRDLAVAELMLAASAAMAQLAPPLDAPAPLGDYQEQLLIMTRELPGQPELAMAATPLEEVLPVTLDEDLAAREVENNVRAFLAS